MNGREQLGSQVSACISAQELLIIIGGGSRLEILRHLLDREWIVSELAEDLELAWPMVSKNLRILRDNGLVNVRQYKKNRIYSLRRERVQGKVNGQYVRLRIRSGTGEWLVVNVRKPVQFNSKGRVHINCKAQ